MKDKEPIFVIGFPKSGNTWLARLIAEVTDSNLNPRNPVDAADFSHERTGNYLVNKEHVIQNMNDILDGKVIYIVRDVRDVLVSGFFHCNRWCDEDKIKKSMFFKMYFNHEINKLNEKWQGNLWAEFTYRIKSFLISLVRDKSEKVRIGSWSNHVLFWTQKKDVVVVRYEDLLQNTEGEVRRILAELKINVDESAVIKTVSNQSFENKKKKFIHSGDVKNNKFLRSGKEGGWQSLLSPKSVTKIEKMHSQVMNKYGYMLTTEKGEE